MQKTNAMPLHNKYNVQTKNNDRWQWQSFITDSSFKYLSCKVTYNMKDTVELNF